MNVEFEVKNILREWLSDERKAEMISEKTTFKKENILKAIKKGGEDASEIYGNLLKFSKNKK